MKFLIHIATGLGAAMLLLLLLSCNTIPDPDVAPDPKNDEQKEETTMPEQIQITISGKTLPVSIENNAATQALVEALRKASITYTASDYGGFEKVGALGRSLPTSNSQMTTQAGDVILYNGNQVVLFYGSNSWSYTRLGKIKYSSLDELKSFLKAGKGDISVTISL